MHIAWLGKKSPFCGNVTYSREVTNALLERGHRVSFLHFAQDEARFPRGDASRSGNGSDGEALQSPDLQEVSLPFLYKSQVYTIPSLRASKVLARSLEDLRPDLVHASLTLSPLDFVLPEICRDLNLPLVATFHPAFDRKLRNFNSGTQHLTYQLYAPFLAHYDCTVVFSQIQREMLMRLGVSGDRVCVIPNGVDVQKYSPGPSRLKTELGAARTFVYQGRIAQEKNVEALLKAWKQAEMPPWSRLAIVGDGPLKPMLQNLYGPELGVVWLGFVADEAKRIEILRGSDAFILPSWVEGLSLSLLEAMACGVACLATDVGADGEVLEDGAGVVLNPSRVAAQLQALLPFFCDHGDITRLLGQKARARVLERYTLSGNIAQLETLYARVLRQTRPLSSSL